VTGCLRPTPIDNLFGLPTELRRKRASLSLARRAMDPQHFFHDRLLFAPTTQQRELKSRHPFVPAALELLKDQDKSNTTAAFGAELKQKTEWQKSTFSLHTFIPSPGLLLPGMTLLRPSWVRLNRLHTGVGLFHSTMHKWGLVPSANCRCGANGQPHTSLLPPIPPFKWDTWFGGSR